MSNQQPMRLLLSWFLWSFAASAEPSATSFRPERLALRVEGGAGSMLSEHQREKLRYSELAMQGTVRLGYALVPLLTPQVSFAYWYPFTVWRPDPSRNVRSFWA
jgi:hypothetical protein